MDYSVEDISPIKKKINVTIDQKQVDAAIMASVAIYKDSLQLDGFRKGKVPASVVEKRFHDQIYNEARQDLVNANINSITNDLKLEPVSGIELDGIENPLQKGNPYTFSMEFEVLPQFAIPNYEGLTVEQEKIIPNQEEIDKIVKHIQRERAKIQPVEGNEPAKDGQIANIDFEAYDNGKLLQDISTQNFDLELGAKASLPEFEDLVKTIAPGQEASGDIHFPDDFLVSDIAGKTLNMHVKVHAVKEPVLPELDDLFAKSMGSENLEKFLENVKNSYIQNKENLAKGVAQKKLLDQLLKQTEFDLPPSMVKMENDFLLADLAGRLEKQGRSIGALGKTIDELRDELQPQAEEFTRSNVLLLSIAKKEGLTVNENEVLGQILKNCLRTGQDFNTIRKEYERTGMIFQLRDRLLADKAMDLVYARANIEYQDNVENETKDKINTIDSIKNNEN